jgi:dTDP-4-dehydrorhamnose reductase
VPDLVHASLDLLLDNEQGIFHLVNSGVISWADLAKKVALLSGCDTSLVKAVSQKAIRMKAQRPHYSALGSEKGIKLPALENALERYFEAVGNIYLPNQMAV